MPALVVGAVGCGSGHSGSEAAKIALLLPPTQRYQSIDRPGIERRIEEICEDCEILHTKKPRNAIEQRGQANVALRRGASVLVLSPLNSIASATIVGRANARGVPVLSYDNMALNSEPAAFVSFDRVKTGRLQAESLARKLKRDGSPKGPVVMIDGEPGEPFQYQYEEGARKGFEAAGVRIAKEYDTPFWEPRLARNEMQRAIRALGKDGFAGVYAETDSLAEGAIAAMKTAGIDPAERPTTGRNATVAGLRRILAGRQYMTVYASIEREASAGAEAAVELAQEGEVPPEKITGKVDNGKAEVPSVLLEPQVITKANLARAIAADGFVSIAALCTPAYRADCEAAGISD